MISPFSIEIHFRPFGLKPVEQGPCFAQRYARLGGASRLEVVWSPASHMVCELASLDVGYWVGIPDGGAGQPSGYRILGLQYLLLDHALTWPVQPLPGAGGYAR